MEITRIALWNDISMVAIRQKAPLFIVSGHAAPHESLCSRCQKLQCNENIWQASHTLFLMADDSVLDHGKPPNLESANLMPGFVCLVQGGATVTFVDWLRIATIRFSVKLQLAWPSWSVIFTRWLKQELLEKHFHELCSK